VLHETERFWGRTKRAVSAFSGRLAGVISAAHPCNGLRGPVKGRNGHQKRRVSVNRAQKVEEVAKLNEAFQENETVVITHYSGLSVSEITDLRRRMLDAGGRFKVTKNRLAKRALEGTRFEQLNDMFTGPTAMATSQDPIAAAKIAYEYAKDNDKLVIIGGAMGNTLLDKAGVEALAKMPSLDELRSKIVGLIVAPATRIATVLQQPGTQVARVLGAKAQQG